jgi:DegV family protein with EDD domain
MKVGIVTSSISCLTPEDVQRYRIRVVPIPLTIDGHTHLDGVDLSATEVYRLMAYERPFVTSAPAPGEYLKAFQELSSWAEGILCLTVPRKMSMMFESARTAAAEMRTATVRVVDTGTAAGGQALIDMAAALVWMKQ